MADISISLNQIQDRKTVKIEGLGVLTIRKLGSGEDLDLSFKRRRMNKIIDELSEINFIGLDAKKPSDVKKMDKLSKKAETLSQEMQDIKQYEFEVYKRLLTDDKNGEVVNVVMNTLSDKERAEIFNLAFAQKAPVVVPETMEAPDTETEES